MAMMGAAAAYRQRNVLLPCQEQTLRQHGGALSGLARALGRRGQMRVAAIADQGDLVIATDPRGDGVAVADFPVETLVCLANGGGDARVQRLDQPAHLVHVARLRPRLAHVGRVLVRDDPVELVAAAQRVLHAVHVLADPDVDALVLDELGRHGVAAQLLAREKRPEACVSAGFGRIGET